MECLYWIHFTRKELGQKYEHIFVIEMTEQQKGIVLNVKKIMLNYMSQITFSALSFTSVYCTKKKEKEAQIQPWIIQRQMCSLIITWIHLFRHTVFLGTVHGWPVFCQSVTNMFCIIYSHKMSTDIGQTHIVEQGKKNNNNIIQYTNINIKMVYRDGVCTCINTIHKFTIRDSSAV